MASLQKRNSTLTTSNPITSDKNLTKLLAETKDLDSEEAFSGWKESFLEQYKNYLDPAGVENAEASNGRLLRSLERLAQSVVTVNEFVKEGKITSETQSVQGKRHLTNMTEQMAETEKEVARFLPSTGAEEAMLGYDKFELGAVMIEDGFHVYEHLKTTKDIIQHLQAVILDEVLPKNKQSIIQYYLRQIQTFCDVMADLGLFGLMERMMELYNIKPRSKSKPVKEAPPKVVVVEEVEKPKKPARVLDPNVNYKHRAAYTGGYTDPFSGTQPGRKQCEDPSESDESADLDGEGDDDENHFIVYFDMKTGTIGKIPRDVCRSSKFIVTEDDEGNEQMQGEIEDEAEKEKLIWDMKKAMKGGGGRAAPRSSKQAPKRSNSSASSTSDGSNKPPLGKSRDPPKRTLSAKAKMGSNREEKPFFEIPEKSSSVRGAAPESNEETTAKRAALRRNKSESLVGMRSKSPGALSRRPRLPMGSSEETSSGDGIPISKSPGALSKPRLSGASSEEGSITKSPGALSRKPRLSKLSSDSTDDESSTKSPGALSRKPKLSRLSSDSIGDGTSTKSPGTLSTKSPGTLSRKPRVSRAKSGDGLPFMFPGALSKPRISRAKSGDGLPTKMERTPLEDNNKLAKAAPSSDGWATPSKLATKRRGDE